MPRPGRPQTAIATWNSAYLVSAAVGASVVLTAFVQDSLPIAYLGRPLQFVVLLSAATATLSVPARNLSIPVAATAQLAVLYPVLSLLGLVAIFLYAAVWFVRHKRVSLARPVTAIAISSLIIGLVRLLPALEWRSMPEPYETAGEPPSIYLVLLDGYPRIDTLSELGIDNSGFIQALEGRGFKHYPDATSKYGWTALSLSALLTGAEVSDSTPSVELKRTLRATWTLPAGWVAIDPPVGHVTIPGVPHIDVGGPNDLEAQLIGDSILGQAFPRWSREVLGEAIAERHRRELEALASTTATRVFAHVLAPHPPFVLGTDATAGCWPRACHLFSSVIERTGLSIGEWSHGMEQQIDALNDLVMASTDRILEREPDAVIVFFSDHGGRYTLDESEGEWHRTLLIARTPGRGDLFAGSPHPEGVLERVMHAYGP